MAAQRKMNIRNYRRQSRLFPHHWPKPGGKKSSQYLRPRARTPIVLGPEESHHGSVETYTEAERCAALFKKQAEEIDGIIITLPKLWRGTAALSTLSACRD